MSRNKIALPPTGPDGILRKDSMETATVPDSMLDSAEFDDVLDDDIDEDEEAEAEAKLAEGKSPHAGVDPRQVLYEAQEGGAPSTSAAAPASQ